MFLLDWLPLSLGRLSVGSQESKLQSPTRKSTCHCSGIRKTKPVCPEGGTVKPDGVAAGNGDFPVVLKQEPEGELPLSRARSSCCLGF